MYRLHMDTERHNRMERSVDWDPGRYMCDCQCGVSRVEQKMDWDLDPAFSDRLGREG